MAEDTATLARPKQDLPTLELCTRSGLRLQVRPASPEDEDILADFFAHVSPDDLRFRFLSAVEKVSRGELAILTHVDHRRTENFLAFDGGVLVATAMLAADAALESAEVAISVRSDYRGRGIGWSLLEHVAQVARAKGISKLQSIESCDNHAAIELEREMGFTARLYPGDATLMLVETDLQKSASNQPQGSLPTTMRAAVVRGFGEPLKIEELPVPRPGPGEILVKIEATGVCHTDLHAARGDWPVRPKLPLVPGHEGVGYVAAVGAGVTHVKEGDAVGVPWLYDACGYCTYCTTGWETLCERQRNTGYSVNGTYAEYVLAAADYVGHLPPNPDFAALAPILCAGVTTYKGLKETDAKPGEWVAISGIGGLGHVAVQYAKAMGFHVAALDVDQAKLDLATRLGADVAVNCTDEGAVRDLVKQTSGGMHGVLVTAVSTGAFAQAIGMVRRHGTVSLVGLPPGDFPLPIFPVVLKRITVRGSIVGTRQDLREALAFAAEGKVRANVSVEPLENVNDVFERMEAARIEGRIVLTP